MGPASALSRSDPPPRLAPTTPPWQARLRVPRRSSRGADAGAGAANRPVPPDECGRRPSSAVMAAGGRSRSAGSQTVRSTANGSPCWAATFATAPLSKSTARAPLRSHACRFAARVTRMSGAASTQPNGCPRRAARAPSVSQRAPDAATTPLRHDHRPGAQTRRQAASQPEADEAVDSVLRPGAWLRRRLRLNRRRRPRSHRQARGPTWPQPPARRRCRPARSARPAKASQNPKATRRVLPSRRLR